jgi:TMEM175 potassium channel family protein
MGKGRLEAFSDGVIAIIITIMVLELKIPEAADPRGLAEVAPHVAIYALSFIYVGIYWSNHHHMLHAAGRGVTGAILWANLHLLFWLSLVPFASAYMGAHMGTRLPVALYGVVLLMSGAAYWILARLLVQHEGAGSLMAHALGRDWKTILSITVYMIAIVLAWFAPMASLGLYAAVAAAWLIPDRRIENAVRVDGPTGP